QYLSLDPYMRGSMNDGRSYATPLEIGEVMTGETVAHVLVSNNSVYVKGDVVLARTGWRTHALSDGTGLRKLDPAVGAADFPARLAAACPQGIDVYFENVGGAIWEAVLPLLNDFARVTVAGLIAQYNGVPPGDGTDRLPATMRQILSKRLTIRGLIYYDFAAEHYADFLREVGAGDAAGRMRDR